MGDKGAQIKLYYGPIELLLYDSISKTRTRENARRPSRVQRRRDRDPWSGHLAISQ